MQRGNRPHFLKSGFPGSQRNLPLMTTATVKRVDQIDLLENYSSSVVDDITILANAPNQAETLLHSLERANAGIGLHVNAHKTEYMCYNQTGDISTLDGPL